MREAARRRVLQTLPEDALVLDVGGWAVPFPRADHVLDLGAYDTRGTWGYDGDRAEERFTRETWTQRDVCDREPWPYDRDQFDFAICSHTLEDLRDPVWVCSELQRVARAGYIEVPSRVAEQCYGIQGPWAGWTHHHWLIDVDQDAQRIDFVFKPHHVHTPPHHLPAGSYDGLSEEQRVSALWWQGSFTARERIFDSAAELDAYLDGLVRPSGARGRLRALRGR